MTSSTSTQYSFEQQDAELSIYTQYLVEGVETSKADLDSDGAVSVQELHQYVSQRVEEKTPAMKLKIYVAEEGFIACAGGITATLTGTRASLGLLSRRGFSQRAVPQSSDQSYM
ncbi:MAG: hypothetical protein HC800_03120 [Phormidesmis sp. RL_2_1]|nr:hypothetical protein [Phormidesmis sp. RL_2_1]